MEGQGEGLPRKGVVAQSMLLPVPAAAASERVAACRTCRSAALLVETERYRRSVAVAAAAERVDTLPC